jgi:hypothetical protein
MSKDSWPYYMIILLQSITIYSPVWMPRFSRKKPHTTWSWRLVTEIFAAVQMSHSWSQGSQKPMIHTKMNQFCDQWPSNQLLKHFTHPQNKLMSPSMLSNMTSKVAKWLKYVSANGYMIHPRNNSNSGKKENTVQSRQDQPPNNPLWISCSSHIE